MTSALEHAGLSALYTAGQPIVLPHAHAARTLRARLGAASPLPDATAPEPVPPLAWHEWTAALWSGLLLEGRDDRVLLNRLQEEQLWADILSEQAPGAEAASLREAATLARSGLQRAAAHCVVDRLRTEADSPDSHRFAAALGVFRSQCARFRLLPAAFLDEALSGHLAFQTMAAPDRVHLVGFDGETPAQGRLLAALAKAGTAVHRHTMRVAPVASGRRLSCEFTDRGAELRFAVRSIAHLARPAGTPPPGIALVCLDRKDDRPALERLFLELLASELQSINTDLSSTPWLFVTQPPLRSAPIVAAAIEMLRWTVAPLSMEGIGQLLLSPFFAHSDSFENRGRFEAHTLRRAPVLRPSLNLLTFLPLLRTQRGRNTDRHALFPELSALARAAHRAEVATTAKRSHAQWTDVVRQLLRTVGWPGVRAASPAEFRLVGAWEGLLDNLSTLQAQGGSVTFPSFLDLLLTEAGSLPSPATDAAAPLQVLSLAETEGLSFDLTLVLDATEGNLPVLEHRHPFLPQGLQRTLGFGDPVRDIARTRALLDSLALRSAQTLLLAPADADDAPARLSPLAAQLAFRPVPPSTLLPGEAPLDPVRTESAGETDSPPPLQDVDVHGGAEVLRLQAACGFRAFASLRLAAEDAQSHGLGLDPRDVGRVLHTSLELFWTAVKTQAALRSLPPEARRHLISQSVVSALARLRPFPQAGDAWSTHFLRVLELRFTNLLLRWLESELGRSPFTVLAQEQVETLTLGPIRLKLRPDRIDEVEGGLVFVDYKSTYDLSVDQWTDRRPDAPQLPSYALCAAPEQLQGIAFAQIRPDSDKRGWISLSQRAGIFPKKRNKQVDMRDQLAVWRDALTLLAEAFAAGDARVDPKSYPDTCTYCAHRALCRLDPNTLSHGAETEDESNEEEETVG